MLPFADLRVLVTGACGFIGRRLVARLAAQGDEVRALVLPGETVPPAVRSAAAIATGDVTDSDSVKRAARGIDAVVHLAAIVGDWGREEDFDRVNAGGTANVLRAAANSGATRVVAVSSIVVYGKRLAGGICHEASVRAGGFGPYGRSKVRAEEIALSYAPQLEVVIVRPGNVFGPGSRPWVDQLGEILQKGGAMLIDGGRGDAHLAYVDNVVEVLRLTLAHPKAPGHIYNAVDEEGVTWKRYTDDLAAIVGGVSPKRSVSRPTAETLARSMEFLWRLARRKTRPLLTREAVALLASRSPIPMQRARSELGYHAPVGYQEAMGAVEKYWSESR